jgi:hypothetical protein
MSRRHAGGWKANEVQIGGWCLKKCGMDWKLVQTRKEVDNSSKKVKEKKKCPFFE